MLRLCRHDSFFFDDDDDDDDDDDAFNWHIVLGANPA